jgi:hypothetical protein
MPFGFCLRMLQLAEELPRHPQQQQPAGQPQSDDIQQPQGDRGEQDAQDRRRRDPDQDRAPPLRRRQARRGHADDDGIVAGEHDIDDDHRGKRGDLV